jgi:RNA polymerase sigma-70 factor, ECF subfamily
MDKYSELIRRAQGGDPDAVRALIERNQAVVYRLALSIMDNPAEAAEVSKETFIKALSGLDEYNGIVAFPTWLYSITAGVCRDRLRRKRFVQRLPGGLGAIFRHSSPPAEASDPEPPAERAERLVWLTQQLDDSLRLPLVLRYDHALSVQEMSPLLDTRERTIHSHLMAARARLREGLDEQAAGNEANDPNHRRARKLMEDAADRLITDSDAKWLEDHMRACADCKNEAQRLVALETEISMAFHRCWDDCPVPAADFSSAVQDRRRLRTAGRHSLSLAGALMVGLVAIGVVIFLPSFTPADVILLTPTATPIPTYTPNPRAGFRDFVRPTVVPLPNNTDLLSSVYPGRLAYVDMAYNYRPLGDHLFTMLPNGANVLQLTSDLAQNSSPAWSPDGSQIAFLAVPPDGGQNQVYVVNADGSDLQQVSTGDIPHALPSPTPPIIANPFNRYPAYGQPRWSPDSTQLVVPLLFSPNSSYLVLLSPTGGAAHYLEVDNVDRNLIAWAPDGRSVAFIAQNGQALWVWNPALALVDGTNPKRMFYDGSWDMAYGLTWSPDANRIALIVGKRDTNDIFNLDLRIFNRFGVQSTTTISLWSGADGNAPGLRSSELAWSPDGAYLAFVSFFNGQARYSNQLTLIRPDGSDKKVLVQGDRGLNSFTWSPDGRWIAFSTGFQIWGASLDAFEKGEVPLVELAGLPGSALSWQKVK